MYFPKKNHQQTNLFFLLYYVFLTWTACNNNPTPMAQAMPTSAPKKVRQEVHIQKLEPTIFKLKTITNGTLIPFQKAPIAVKTSGILETFSLREGQYIKKGTRMATMEKEALELRLQQAKNDLDEALLKKTIC